MSIRVTCDGCFMEYKVPDQRAGKAFKCKECGERIRVPRPGQPSPERQQAAPTARQRSKPATKKRKKRSRSSSGNGVPIGVVAGSLAVLGIVGYLVLPRGDDVPAGPNDVAVNDSSTNADEVAKTHDDTVTTDTATVDAAIATTALSADEEKVITNFKKMILSQVRATPVERKAAIEKFATDHKMTEDELLAIANRAGRLRAEANKVDSNWQPLSIGPLPSTAWPTQANISVPVRFSGAAVSLPVLQTPFVLTSAALAGGTERHVFDLTSSQEVGRWTSKIAASKQEQVSPDGRWVCLQEGFKPPITLHIVDVQSGETAQSITSPDIFRVEYLAFIGPQRLIVKTPLTTQRTRDKKRRCLIVDATTGNEVSRFEHEFHFTGDAKMSASPDGRYLVMAGKGKSIEVLEIDSGKQVCALDLANEGLPAGQLRSVAVSPDGKQIAVLERQSLKALRLYVIDFATGEITRKADLFGGTTSLGASLEMQLDHPLVWFPGGRFVLIGKLAAVDTTTGRRVWQAQGKQVGMGVARLPAGGSLLYQSNTKGTSKLVTLPIDFDRIASTQAAWPDDAILSPEMTVSVAIDLSADGLAELDGVVKTGLEAKLERLGFTVSDDSERTLTIEIQNDAVAFAWTQGDDVMWESVATSHTSMIPQLGHMKGKSRVQALRSEGIVLLQAYPIPYFIAADRQWTLPVIDPIDHEG